VSFLCHSVRWISKRNSNELAKVASGFGITLLDSSTLTSSEAATANITTTATGSSESTSHHTGTSKGGKRGGTSKGEKKPAKIRPGPACNGR